MAGLIGLTGGIGSGKSAAAEHFQTLGVIIVDADIASRAVVEPGQAALQDIAAHFGADILDASGALDRTALRHKVYADPAERAWLQGLLHPLINAYLKEHITASTSSYTLLVNPLLLETRQHTWCDRVLVIDVPEQIQLERTMARDNNTREQVENIMRAQAHREQRLAQAQDVIMNDGDLATLHRRVEKMHEQYLALYQPPVNDRHSEHSP